MHVQGQDIDAAENMARQAFGACLCAVQAVNGVVYKLAGSEVTSLLFVIYVGVAYVLCDLCLKDFFQV